MNKCPITYEVCDEGKFSSKGLKRLSSKLQYLQDLPFDAKGLRLEAMQRASKLSIQGVQPKLSAILSTEDQQFKIVDSKGRYILKMQTDYPELPENEDLTMHLAATAGFNVPLHGLIYAKDQSLVYFIKRFDRIGSSKIATEDFAQLAGATRETKYDFSMERLIQIIENFCTFPVVEKVELFKRTIFNFLTGNEDMHLKNFSIIFLEGVVRLAPVYDFVNSTIVLRSPEELALPLKGKKNGLTKKILLQYFGKERLGLSDQVIDEHLQNFTRLLPTWDQWIDKSFLSSIYQNKYKEVIYRRAAVLDLKVPEP